MNVVATSITARKQEGQKVRLPENQELLSCKMTVQQYPVTVAIIQWVGASH